MAELRCTEDRSMDKAELIAERVAPELQPT